MNANGIGAAALSVVTCGISSFAVFVLASRGSAEGVHIVVPNQYENAEAPNFGGIPTGPFRFQQVFAASQFSSLPPGQRTIVSFAMRPDASVMQPGSFTFSDTVIKMSTTNRNPGELSLMFSENVGPDEVVVFQGDLSLSTANTGPAGGPKDFDFVFGLQTPFTYDPDEGNLIFDIMTAGTNLAISQTLDFVVQPGPDFEEVVGGSRYGGNVIQFTFVLLPGDYNENGVVDAADYVVWRKDDGTQAGYDTWRANFGAMSGSGAALPSAEPLSAAIPEPASTLLISLAAALLLISRHWLPAKNRC